MNNGQCVTCKHWGNAKDEGKLFRECQRIVQDRDQASDCDEFSTDPENVLDETAVVIDGSGYFAKLRSKANFGCVMHEAEAN
jgi:hypothetical protein